MTLMVLDAELKDRLIAERQASGADRFDEVWEGVYMVAPLANNEHTDLQAGLVGAIRNALGWGTPARVQPGANVSDREEDWTHDYRCPDVVVVLSGSRARDCGTHWFGGPDFAVEIASTGDRSREKFEFYTEVGLRELVLLDRQPWQLELYRLSADGHFELVGRSDPAGSAVVKSEVLPVSLRLVAGPTRPQIEVVHHDGVQRWLV